MKSVHPLKSIHDFLEHHHMPDQWSHETGESWFESTGLPALFHKFEQMIGGVEHRPFTGFGTMPRVHEPFAGFGIMPLTSQAFEGFGTTPRTYYTFTGFGATPLTRKGFEGFGTTPVVHEKFRGFGNVDA
jgi:hypothetical protein